MFYFFSSLRRTKTLGFHLQTISEKVISRLVMHYVTTFPFRNHLTRNRKLEVSFVILSYFSVRSFHNDTELRLPHLLLCQLPLSYWRPLTVFAAAKNTAASAAAAALSFSISEAATGLRRADTISRRAPLQLLLDWRVREIEPRFRYGWAAVGIV